MKIRLFLVALVTCGCFLSCLTHSAGSAWYQSDIQYQQAITKILKRGDITWGDKTDNYYNFGSVQVSADGLKVFFTGRCEFCDPAEVRPFLVDPDGSNIQDLSGMLPLDITNRWSAWRNQVINDDASKIFFRASVEAGYYDDHYLYVYDISSSTLQLAVDQKFSPPPSDWHFRINEAGGRVYLDKYDGGYSDLLGHNMRGLFFANTGGPKQFYFDIYDLPCDSQCGNLNLFFVMGTSFRNDRAFFSWNSDYYQTDGSNQHTGLYYAGWDGIAIRLGDEHYWIDSGDWRGICDTEGTQVIYRYKHQSGGPSELAVVNVNSEEENVVGWTSGLNGFDSHMSRSGKYILANGEYGDSGAYYQTMIDLAANTSRDTWSYYLPSRGGSTSNITEDDRYYFYSLDGWPNDGEPVAGVYRIDMQSTGDAKAPYVQSIEFSSPVLLDQDDTVIAVQVKISDPQGIENIEWVKLRPLVEGQEDPAWYMAREPLAFPTGDLGSTYLYDDGTHGDATAGDGIFTFDSIATRKDGRYEIGAYNTWYQHYALPAEVGIRIIVKDEDNNYTLADTTLTIFDDNFDIDGDQDVDGSDLAGYLTSIADLAGFAAVFGSQEASVLLVKGDAFVKSRNLKIMF